MNLQVFWNPALGSDVSWIYTIPWKRKSGGDAVSHEWGSIGASKLLSRSSLWIDVSMLASNTRREAKL